MLWSPTDPPHPRRSRSGRTWKPKKSLEENSSTFSSLIHCWEIADFIFYYRFLVGSICGCVRTLCIHYNPLKSVVILVQLGLKRVRTINKNPWCLGFYFLFFFWLFVITLQVGMLHNLVHVRIVFYDYTIMSQLVLIFCSQPKHFFLFFF